MKTYTLSLFFFHITAVRVTCLSWAKPLLERKGDDIGSTCLGLDMGRLAIYAAPGRPELA
ncbi:hypothetical protein ACUXV3_10985 [Roseobacteraceae bacterium NS-SX3]